MHYFCKNIIRRQSPSDDENQNMASPNLCFNVERHIVVYGESINIQKYTKFDIFFSFQIISTCLIIYSLTYYFKEKEMLNLHEQNHLVAHLLGLDLKIETVNIILSMITLVSFFWMIFSILLVVGTIKVITMQS